MKVQPSSILAGRYRVEGFLGEGGMGEVWSATHLGTGRQVAIKRLTRRPHESEFGEARARFVLEARSACAVDHPNVVEVFDVVGEDDEVPFIVMELLEGETLAERLRREGALTPLETARLLLPVVSAVGTAHARGIVHRDLKPANIFLTRDRSGGALPVVKVLDFGIAKWLGDAPPDAELRTQTGSTLGTPSYMSPEQATGERSIDHRSDVWSLGVILYECLSGVRPVEGENAAQMVMRLLSSGIMPIDQLVGDLPPGWADLVTTMLRREVHQRPDDLQPVFDALASVSDVGGPAFARPLLAQREPSSRAKLDPSEPRLEGAAPRGAGTAARWTPPTRRESHAGRDRDEPARTKHARFRPGWVVAAVTGAMGFLVTLGWLASTADGHSWTMPTADLTKATRTTERAGAQTLAPANLLAPALPDIQYLTSQEDVEAISKDRREPPRAPAPVPIPPVPIPPVPSARGSSSAPSKPSPATRATSTKSRRHAKERPPSMPTGSTAGTPCETSAQCKSRLCVAYTCR